MFDTSHKLNRVLLNGLQNSNENCVKKFIETIKLARRGEYEYSGVYSVVYSGANAKLRERHVAPSVWETVYYETAALSPTQAPNHHRCAVQGRRLGFFFPEFMGNHVEYSFMEGASKGIADHKEHFNIYRRIENNIFVQTYI